MMPPTVCPGREVWKAFLLGRTPEGEAHELEQHLLCCAACQQAAGAAGASDALVEALQAQRGRPRLQNPQIEGLCRRLHGLQPPAEPELSAPTANPAVTLRSQEAASANGSVAVESARGLAPAQGPGEMGRLGQYRVLRLLGQGGMGVVYHAEDTVLKRPVALKVMRADLACDERNRQRFLREARAMAQLAHDHIVPVFQVGEEAGMPFLAMPFLQGQTLEDRLRYEPMLPLAEALRIAREVASGLAAAHARNVIHRDIKPGNLWLEEGTGRVKILDFGLAWMEAPEGEQTAHGALMGTPGYMAPEQSEGQADARADLFSLGCVLYRMATGESPFRGTTAMQKMRSVLLDTPRPPHEVNPAIPEAVSQFLQRLLARDPAERPTSAAVAARVLETFQGQFARTLCASPPPLAIPVPGAGPAPLAIPVPPEDLTTPNAPRPAPRPAWRPEGPPWSHPRVLAGAACLVAALLALGIWKATRPRPGPGPEVAGPPQPSAAQASAGRIYGDHWIIPLKPERVLTEAPVTNSAWVLRPTQLPDLSSWTIHSVYLPRGQGVTLAQQQAFVAGRQVLSQVHSVLRTTFPLHAWDLATGTGTTIPFPGECLALTPDGKTGVIFAEGALGLYDTSEPRRRQIALLDALDGPPVAVLSPDGKRLATLRGRLTLWDIASRERLAELAGAFGAVAWSADNERMACWLAPGSGASQLAIIRPVRSEAGDTVLRIERSWKIGKPPVYEQFLRWSPDGKRIALWGQDGVPVFIEDLEGEGRMVPLDVGEKLEFMHVLEGSWSWPFPLAFSPDGKQVAVAAARDHAVLLWDLEGQKVVHRLPGHTETVYSLFFLPDGETLVSSSHHPDMTMRFWSVKTGQPRGTLVPIMSSENKFLLLALSADGHHSEFGPRNALLRYVVKESGGKRQEITPAEFDEKYGWKNDLRKVSLDGR